MPVVLKKEHVEIPGIKKKDMEFPWGLVFGFGIPRV